MKKLILLPFLLLPGYASFSQKPTGGCGIRYGGTSLIPCDKPDQVYVGDHYHLVVYMEMTGCEPPYGYYEATVNGKMIGTAEGGEGKTEIPLDKIALAPGNYTLTICYHNEDEWCKGTLYTTQNMTVIDKDPIKIVPNARPETAKTPAVSGNDTLSLYPNPARNSFCIDGLKPAETSYEFTALDQHGRQLFLGDVNRVGPKLTISAATLPDGFYYLRLKTNQRTWKTKVQVVH